jgi:hypothetical protein
MYVALLEPVERWFVFGLLPLQTCLNIKDELSVEGSFELMQLCVHLLECNLLLLADL